MIYTQVAIDGYSGCGKSTLAKALAARLGWLYIDSGAMYRCAALFFTTLGIPATDVQAINNRLNELHVELNSGNNGSYDVLLNGKNVTAEIREAKIDAIVSEYAAVAAIRERLVALQRQYALQGNVIMDGRDIGSYVFPEAAVKLFMTADPEVRARRRLAEIQAKGLAGSFDEVLNNLEHRDVTDATRKASPLKKAADAITIDNTQLSEKEQLELALGIIKEKQVL